MQGQRNGKRMRPGVAVGQAAERIGSGTAAACPLSGYPDRPPEDARSGSA